MNTKLKDLLVGSAPVVSKTLAEKLASLTLDDWTNIASIAGTIIGTGVGTAYVIWKWRKDAQEKAK